MAIKKPSQQMQKPEVTPQQADILANQLADKPYGGKPQLIEAKQPETEIARTTISLPKHLLESIEDLAMSNKRQGIDPKSFSAVVRDALDQYITHMK